MEIKVTYRACDGARIARKFKTLGGAKAFAHKYVGECPEMGSSYAASGDGIGTVRVEGITLRELFPAKDGGVKNGRLRC